MIKSFIAVLLFIGVSFSANSQQSNSLKAPEKLSDSLNPDDPYFLNLEVQESEGGDYKLVAALELDSGCYFVSPYSKDSYKGFFQIILKDNPFVQLDGNFVEFPLTKAKPDKWQGGLSHFVEENTSYTHKLAVNSTEDFKITGFVQFVIEPKCTLEEIPFSISYVNGKLLIQKFPKLDKRTCTKKI